MIAPSEVNTKVGVYLQPRFSVGVKWGRIGYTVPLKICFHFVIFAVMIQIQVSISSVKTAVFLIN